jgi:hypothetical protein
MQMRRADYNRPACGAASSMPTTWRFACEKLRVEFHQQRPQSRDLEPYAAAAK